MLSLVLFKDSKGEILFFNKSSLFIVLLAVLLWIDQGIW